MGNRTSSTTALTIHGGKAAVSDMTRAFHQIYLATGGQLTWVP